MSLKRTIKKYWLMTFGGNDIESTLTFIIHKWEELFPEHVLYSYFLDEDFAARTTLNAPLYGLAVVSALILSIITVIFQGLKAATSNPVDEPKEE